MRVILLSDQRDLGKRGEVVEVKPGFGRSYLLPQGLALEATEANVTYFERQRQKVDARDAQEQRAGEAPAPSRWDDLLGPFYSASQVAQLCGGISLQALEERRERRQILGLRTADGVLVYPAFQFDEQNRILEGLPEILQCFPAGYVDDWALAGWLVSPLRGLDGVSAVQWLRDGKDAAPVLILARDAAHRFSQ